MFNRRIAVVSLAVSFLFACSSSSSEVAADAPNAVKKAATKVFGKNAKLTYEKEGKGVYEVGTATELEVVIDESGTVHVTEVEIPVASLPLSVLAAVRAKLAQGAQIREAEVQIKPTGVTFEVEAKVDGKEVEYVVSADGSLVTKGDEEGDSDEGEDDDD